MPPLFLSISVPPISLSLSLCVGAGVFTILRARPQQVNDVLVFSNHLHHLHLRDQIRQILLCGVIWEAGREGTMHA